MIIYSLCGWVRSKLIFSSLNTHHISFSWVKYLLKLNFVDFLEADRLYVDEFHSILVPLEIQAKMKMQGYSYIATTELDTDISMPEQHCRKSYARDSFISRIQLISHRKQDMASRYPINKI